MQKDFITALPDSGTGNATVTVSATQNTGNERSTSIQVAGGSMTRTIFINQVKGYGTYHFLNDDTDFCQWNDLNSAIRNLQTAPDAPIAAGAASDLKDDATISTYMFDCYSSETIGSRTVTVSKFDSESPYLRITKPLSETDSQLIGVAVELIYGIAPNYLFYRYFSTQNTLEDILYDLWKTNKYPSDAFWNVNGGTNLEFNLSELSPVLWNRIVNDYGGKYTVRVLCLFENEPNSGYSNEIIINVNPDGDPEDPKTEFGFVSQFSI